MVFNLPVNCQLDFFDKAINPILLYFCEVWGYENLDIIEKVHFKVLKFILNLKPSTPNCMVVEKLEGIHRHVLLKFKLLCTGRKF